MSTITISTTDERVLKIDNYVKTNLCQDRSTFINQSVDFYFKHIRIGYLQDFMYFIGIPMFMFLIMTGLTLYFANVYFFVINGLTGIYFMIFVYLFYNKYRGVKWR